MKNEKRYVFLVLRMVPYDGRTNVEVFESEFIKHTSQGSDVFIKNHPLYIIVSMS